MINLIKHKKYLDNILEKVDPNIKLGISQRKIITNNSKILKVIAGAGSGKTTVIVAKIKYMIDIKKINPDEIVVISYTNKSVEDIKKELIKLEIKIRIYTFHTLALNLINNKSEILVNSPVIKNYIKETIPKFIKEIKTTHPELFNKTKTEYMCGKENIILFSDYIINNINRVNMKNNLVDSEEAIKKYFKEIYTFYKKYKAYNNFKDFEDIINTCLKEEITVDFKYLFIDEYQDISDNRHELIKRIVNEHSIHLTVVGDDFQSIYEFSGSNISLFTEFHKYYENTKILKIEKTYRNSKELNHIANKFILQNKNQIKKQIISNKTLNNPIEISYYNDFYESDINLNNKTNDILKKINKLNDNKPLKIYILGRFNHDLDILKSNRKLTINKNKITLKTKNNLQIEYHTVHSSKGLTCDYTIGLNNKHGPYGFPALKETNYLFEENKIDIEEERRLYYVLLTRTKNKIYLLTPKYNYSIFISELKKFIKN